jgi:hypothetical protein
LVSATPADGVDDEAERLQEDDHFGMNPSQNPPARPRLADRQRAGEQDHRRSDVAYESS